MPWRRWGSGARSRWPRRTSRPWPFLLKGARLLSTVPQRPARLFAERFGLAMSPVPVALPDFDVSMLWHASYDHDPAHSWLRGTIARLAAEL